MGLLLAGARTVDSSLMMPPLGWGVLRGGSRQALLSCQAWCNGLNNARQLE